LDWEEEGEKDDRNEANKHFEYYMMALVEGPKVWASLIPRLFSLSAVCRQGGWLRWVLTQHLMRINDSIGNVKCLVSLNGSCLSHAVDGAEPGAQHRCDVGGSAHVELHGVSGAPMVDASHQPRSTHTLVHAIETR